MKSFDIPSHFRSSFIQKLKEERKQSDRMKKDFSPSKITIDGMTVLLARHFGFCYGVENAIEVSFRAIEENPDKPIYLLSEIIHNPIVNQNLLDLGVRFIMDTSGNQLIPWDEITEDAIIIVPAFGTTLEIESILKEKNLKTQSYVSTCPFVEKVWNKAAQIGQKGYSIIIHGKPNHEESKSTFSHSQAEAPTLLIRNLDEAKFLADFVLGKRDKEEFMDYFKGRYSHGFDPEKDLQRIGVVNQTTMLASDTQEISDYLKKIYGEHFNKDEENIQDVFADTRDTLCYATNDNQSSVLELLKEGDIVDYAIVVGGPKSSNTSHLYDLLKSKYPSYYIQDADCLVSDKIVRNWDFQNQEFIETEIPAVTKSPTIIISSGASCPDSIVEDVIGKLYSLYGKAKYFDHWKENYMESKEDAAAEK